MGFRKQYLAFSYWAKRGFFPPFICTNPSVTWKKTNTTFSWECLYLNFKHFPQKSTPFQIMSADSLPCLNFFHMLHMLERHVDESRYSVTLLRGAWKWQGSSYWFLKLFSFQKNIQMIFFFTTVITICSSKKRNPEIIIQTHCISCTRPFNWLLAKKIVWELKKFPQTSVFIGL